MVVIEKNSMYSLSHSMYPSMLYNLEPDSVDTLEFQVPPNSSVYGVVLKGEVVLRGKNLSQFAAPGQYFCAPAKDVEQLSISGHVALFVRYGFNGQRQIGGPIEASGRLTYIDNCSSSLLIYPPRKGDPSMSMLNFPRAVTQTYHIHPSFRMGVITQGKGGADLGDGASVKLEPGVVFCMEEREIHRFVTEDSTLTFVSFHPDGNWGPEDETHPVMGRTYIEPQWKK